MRFWGVFAVFSVLLLTACSNLDTSPPPMSASGESWHARGRFSYQADDMSESGNFDWRQSGNQYQVRLYGPLGMGTVRITGEPGTVRIQTADQDISSDQPLSLMYHMTGLAIPLNSLPHWLLGAPAGNNASSRRLNPDNTHAGFVEHGWRLNYPGYQDSLAGKKVPEELQASKDSVQLRLLIRSFETL